MQKTPFLAHFGSIIPILGQKKISLKIMLLPIFVNSDLVSLCQISKKKTKKKTTTNERISSNMAFRQTHGQTSMNL